MVSATRATASGSGRWLRCATMRSSSPDAAVSERGRGPAEGSMPPLNRNGSSASSISLSRAQYDGVQRSISAMTGWT
jgi:hypothetical protein